MTRREILAIFIGILIWGYFITRSNLNRVHIIEQAQAKIKLYELREKQWQDSVVKYKSHIKLLNQEVVILAHENDSLARKEAVIVNRIIHLPAVAYRPGQLDSIWRKRYKMPL